MIADKLNAQLINQGVGGACFSPDFLEELQFRPDIVTVAYGVNDFLGNSLFTETPHKFFEKLNALYPDNRIFCLLPIWCGNQNIIDGKTLDMGRQYIKEIAEKYQNISVIDCVNFVPHLAEFYWDDVKLHPNDLGFLYYGNHLYKTPFSFLGKSGGENRSLRFKWVCHKSIPCGSKRICTCKTPCTSSSYGKCTYTYPDKNFRMYPGIPRNTEHWDNLYKHRVYIERTIFTLKDCFGLNSLKTHNTLTIKADVFLAGITQLIGVVLAKELHQLKLFKSVRKLIRKIS